MQTITRHLRLDWVDGKPELALPSNADAGPMVVPPQVEIEALHKLAVMGKMRDIKAQTEHLVALDARYRPLADKIQQLARTYTSQALLRPIETPTNKKTHGSKNRQTNGR